MKKPTSRKIMNELLKAGVPAEDLKPSTRKVYIWQSGYENRVATRKAMRSLHRQGYSCFYSGSTNGKLEAGSMSCEESLRIQNID